MSPREIAATILTLRSLLVRGMIAELSDDPEEFDRLLAEFDELAATLPLWAVWRDGLQRRVVDPARRKVEREGILAQSPHSHHAHRMMRHPEIQTWVCSECGFSYMGVSS